jgi:hypothetical protein
LGKPDSLANQISKKIKSLKRTKPLRETNIQESHPKKQDLYPGKTRISSKKNNLNANNRKNI